MSNWNSIDKINCKLYKNYNSLDCLKNTKMVYPSRKTCNLNIRDTGILLKKLKYSNSYFTYSDKFWKLKNEVSDKLFIYDKSDNISFTIGSITIENKKKNKFDFFSLKKNIIKKSRKSALFQLYTRERYRFYSVYDYEALTTPGRDLNPEIYDPLFCEIQIGCPDSTHFLKSSLIRENEYAVNSLKTNKKLLNFFKNKIHRKVFGKIFNSEIVYSREKYKFTIFRSKKLQSIKNIYYENFRHAVKFYPSSYFMKRAYPAAKKLGNYMSFDFDNIRLLQQYKRHPLSQSRYLTHSMLIKKDMDRVTSGYEKKKIDPQFARFFRVYWRYFRFKIERFFFNNIHTRVHVWFLNVWDVFLNGIDALWRWHRYEDKTIYFLTRKGQRFLIEDRENAKFYVRTLALTITMVGGAKLFMDRISLLMKKHRNNWAFILHTTKSLRFCINYFWFRFFVNYKITLQGKIGGFLRAQKKTFKKGNVSIENKASAITYYRGYPVTRFGSYNLSFWLQYRIPNLIEKFGDMEYIDTMKILLSMYSVPWLATRLAEIIRDMLVQRIERIKRKVAQFNRRVRLREALIYKVLKIKKYYFKYTNIKTKNINNVSKFIEGVKLGKNLSKLKLSKNLNKFKYKKKIKKYAKKRNNKI